MTQVLLSLDKAIEKELKNGMAVAFQRSIDASREIKESPRNAHVEALVNLLFGTDSARIEDARGKLPKSK